MRELPRLAFAALLLASTVSVSAFAQSSATGCGPTAHRAESEGGGVATVSNATHKADSEGGGVATVSEATHKADSEGGGVATVGNLTHKAAAEGGGGSQMAAAADPCK